MNSKNSHTNSVTESMFRLGLYTPQMTTDQLNKLADYAEMLLKESPDEKDKSHE